MNQENHYGEPFKGRCPHCQSKDIQEFPTTNLTRKFGCNACQWVFGVKMIDQETYSPCNPIILGCFYLSSEERQQNAENIIRDCINEFVKRVDSKL